VYLIIHEVFIKIVLGSLLHFVARARAREVNSPTSHTC